MSNWRKQLVHRGIQWSARCRLSYNCAISTRQTINFMIIEIAPIMALESANYCCNCSELIPPTPITFVRSVVAVWHVLAINLSATQRQFRERGCGNCSTPRQYMWLCTDCSGFWVTILAPNAATRRRLAARGKWFKWFCSAVQLIILLANLLLVDQLICSAISATTGLEINSVVAIPWI